MKKYLILLAFLCVGTFISSAKDFEPKDSWAYRYEDFVQGKVFNSKGEVILEGKVNISVVDGKLHYVKGESIMEADMLQVFSVTITETKEDIYSKTAKEEGYMNVGGKMFRLLSRSDKSAVLEFMEVDMDKLSKSEIGYGITSSTASTQNLNLAALDGIVQNQANMNYSLASESKGSGERIPVKVSRYLLSRGALVLAKKREVAKIPELDKKALDAFVKSNKLKWDKTEDLQKIADYISDQR